MTEKHNKKFEKKLFSVCRKNQLHITQDCAQGGGGGGAWVVSPWVAEQQYCWPAESELTTKSAKIHVQ